MGGGGDIPGAREGGAEKITLVFVLEVVSDLRMLPSILRKRHYNNYLYTT